MVAIFEKKLTSSTMLSYGHASSESRQQVFARKPSGVHLGASIANPHLELVLLAHWATIVMGTLCDPK